MRAPACHQHDHPSLTARVWAEQSPPSWLCLFELQPYYLCPVESPIRILLDWARAGSRLFSLLCTADAVMSPLFQMSYKKADFTVTPSQDSKGSLLNKRLYSSLEAYWSSRLPLAEWLDSLNSIGWPIDRPSKQEANLSTRYTERHGLWQTTILIVMRDVEI